MFLHGMEISKFIIILSVLLCVPEAFSKVVNSTLPNSKDAHKSGDHLQSYNHLDKLKNFPGNLRICWSFFRKEEFVKYFQECVAQQSTVGEKGILSSSESEETTIENGHHGRREKRFNSLYNAAREIRTLRDVSIRRPIHQREHSRWKMFENPHVFKNPCLISCVLMKFEMINSTGHIDVQKIEVRAQEVLAEGNTTDFVTRASNITTTCIGERDKQEEMLWTSHSLSSTTQNLSSDDLTKAKCRFVIQLGKCLVHNVFEACREDLVVQQERILTTVNEKYEDVTTGTE